MRKRNKTDNLIWASIGVIIVGVIVIGVTAVVFRKYAKPSEYPVTISSEQISAAYSNDSSADSAASSQSQNVTVNGLDLNFSKLLLVNGENPLPEDYDYTGNLVTIEDKYLCGFRNQMDKDALPYATAMIEAAWKDNVELYILSPYRSHSAQVTLFENEVNTQMKKGLTREEAEIEASTEVARPGTSEHHTGLAIDFNSVESKFENTEGYEWLKKNAEDYGFVMRYPQGKEDVTGVIYEPWHWRFIGIKHAKEMNRLNLCFEEYVRYLDKQS